MPGIDREGDDVNVEVVLDVVDATLAGEPVDPAYAELAELTLLLADERPSMEPKFAGALDQAVQRRFERVGRRDGGVAGPVVRGLRRRWWLWSPAAGLAAVLIAAVVIVAAGTGQPTSSSVVSSAGSASAPHRASAPAPAVKAPVPSAAASTAPAAPTLQPPANGRKVIQGAQLSLSAASNRIDDVAQEVFVVVGQVRGVVNSSNVTASGGPGGGYAQFQLSIPSSELSQAMASLSTLRYTKVASRTDTTQDVNDEYEADVRALADARARRTSLLRALANAATQAQIDSLTARIRDADASISSDEATLRRLGRQVNYSQVGVTINGGVVPLPVASHGGGGFGLGQAAHDAGRVLIVAAGIALIGAAGLVPLALLAGLGWWLASMLRRRRRQQVLDLV
jgi:hypothetical protein